MKCRNVGKPARGRKTTDTRLCTIGNRQFTMHSGRKRKKTPGSIRTADKKGCGSKTGIARLRCYAKNRDARLAK